MKSKIRTEILHLDRAGFSVLLGAFLASLLAWFWSGYWYKHVELNWPFCLDDSKPFEMR
jgi:hypothetical protein